MAEPARRSAARPAPGWGEVREAVMRAVEACTCGQECVAALLEVGAQLRRLAFDEDMIEQERARAAEEALAAAGLAPEPRGRHLRAVR